MAAIDPVVLFVPVVRCLRVGTLKKNTKLFKILIYKMNDMNKELFNDMLINRFKMHIKELLILQDKQDNFDEDSEEYEEMGDIINQKSGMSYEVQAIYDLVNENKFPRGYWYDVAWVEYNTEKVKDKENV